LDVGSWNYNRQLLTSNDQLPTSNLHLPKTQIRLEVTRHAAVAGIGFECSVSEHSKPTPDTPTRRPEAGASLGRGTIRGILAAKVTLCKSGRGDFGIVFRRLKGQLTILIADTLSGCGLA
jgi:hypothetical protein